MNANITRDEALKLLKAAGCSRDVIKYGSELLGLDLNKLFLMKPYLVCVHVKMT